MESDGMVNGIKSIYVFSLGYLQKRTSMLTLLYPQKQLDMVVQWWICIKKADGCPDGSFIVMKHSHGR